MMKAFPLSLAVLLCATGASHASPHSPSATDPLAVSPREPSSPTKHERLGNQRYMPSGDPNLDPSWDWTVSGPGHTLYYAIPSGGIASTVRQLPFYTAGHSLNTLQKDMYPQDGWTLVYRDFGTPNAAPDVPSFALYNKYRGILRVMFFNTRELSYTQFLLELSFKDTTATGALLTYSDSTRAFLNDYDTGRTENYAVVANSINGWIYGDFMLTGYDPNLSAATQLRLHIRGMNLSQVTLESTQFTLNEVLTEANPTHKSTLNGLVDAINAGSKSYGSINSVAKSMRETAEKNSSSWWKTAVTGLLGTSSAPKLLSGLGPVVGGLMGFVSSFFGGAETPAPREPLNFNGSLKLSGSITTSVPLYSIDLALKAPATGGNPPDYYRPVQDLPWGVFNLTAKPQVKVVRTQICRTQSFVDCYFRTNYSPAAALSYVFNPNAGLDLVSVSYAYTFGNAREPTGYDASPTYVAYARRGEPADPAPTGIAVKVVLRTRTPTLYLDDDLVFYKVYPITLIPTF